MKLLNCLLLTITLALPVSANEVALKIANHYGLQSWNKVESISYTFNVKSPNREFGRAWTWYPKEDKVTSHEKGVTYSRSGEMNEEIDKQFINDVFWLLFPFQITWDPSLKFEDEANVKDPISGETVNKLRCIYNKQDGYTPGDIYELFYTDDYTITAWNFIRGGEGEGRPTVWKGNQEFNGITIATDHRNPEGFGLWFSGIEVKLK
ncbi:MAG: hypothetical protein KJT03_03130 [Verrucomicrobiae bacterium]|nr:hypothetical protein [Verrucomicrobiae bacterium]